MAQSIINLTARRISPTISVDLATPKIKTVFVDDISQLYINNKRGGAVVKLSNSVYGSGKIETYETVEQIKTLISPDPADNVLADSALAVTAAGANQGAAYQLLKYFNVVTTATADQGVKLPLASTGKAVVVINQTANNVKVYPGTANYINGLAVNVAIDLPAGTSLQFGPKTSTLYLTAIV